MCIRDRPYYIFQGVHDNNTPSSLVQDYYDAIEAPDKDLVWFEHSAQDVYKRQGLPCAFARAGLALYGVPSAPGEQLPAGVSLRPARALRTRVARVRTIAPGERAGYGRAFTAARPTRLAVLPAGYADGVPRSLSCGRGQVLIGGRAAPVARCV